MHIITSIYKTERRRKTVGAVMGAALLLSMFLGANSSVRGVSTSEPQSFLSYANAGVSEEYINVTRELAEREERVYSSLPLIQSGSAGSAVAIVQSRLAELGYYRGAPDGIFGAETAAAVIRFQEDNSFKPDGIVSTDEYRVLNKSDIENGFG